jgi:hypothetical protein
MSEAGPVATDVGPSDFELNVSIPADPRFAETMRELAVHAAKYVGCTDAQARAFGQQVEAATRGYIENGGGKPSLPLVFRRTTGPVEVLVDGHSLTAEP